jgi:hypothetical protein
MALYATAGSGDSGRAPSTVSTDLLRGKQDPANSKVERGVPQAGGGPVGVCNSVPRKGGCDDGCDGDALCEISVSRIHGKGVLVPRITTYGDGNKLQFMDFPGPPSSK